jgi:uncharacterized membrane protein (UPF0127 family)
VPHSLDVISANRNVLAVLEIKGGAAARLGLSVRVTGCGTGILFHPDTLAGARHRFGVAGASSNG